MHPLKKYFSLKIKTQCLIAFLLVFFSSDGSIAQNIELKITAINKVDVLTLDKIDFKKKHKDYIELQIEIDKVSNYLKNIGYFTNTKDSIVKTENTYTAFFSLNEKTTHAILHIKDSDTLILKSTLKNNLLKVPIENLQVLLSKISTSLESEGKSFSKVQLKNIIIKENTLYADLEIQESQKRTINKVILKGYEDFPKSFLKNYFNIKSNSVFHQNKMKKISDATKNLSFVTEIKSPEVLFTKDSTFLYLYFKKKSNNSFDGIVNFATKENGDFLFNGHIDLKLNNILNAGEYVALFWNRIGEQKQELKITAEVPYIFNTRISPRVEFSIYKQDSTFFNTNFITNVDYNISNRLKFGVSFNFETSEDLQDSKTTSAVESYSSAFYGLNLEYRIAHDNFFQNDKFFFKISPYFGKRKDDANNTNQLKIKATASYLWELSSRNHIYLKNNTGYLKSDNYLTNELFRTGGVNSIRGFNEQSIFTDSYTFFNLEYRFLTSQKSYLYTITDVAFIENETVNNNLLGVGLGYLFITNNSKINISTTIGKTNSLPIDFKSIKLAIGWINYF